MLPWMNSMPSVHTSLASWLGQSADPVRSACNLRRRTVRAELNAKLSVGAYRRSTPILLFTSSNCQSFGTSQLSILCTGSPNASRKQPPALRAFDRWVVQGSSTSHGEPSRRRIPSPSRLRLTPVSPCRMCVCRARASCFPAVTIARKPFKCQW